ncbi:hypothetical protein CC77DRAFT_1062894 [Alternaria alternata]|uniref:Uncharacterized protein n=2 Tax=Alternaria alternata complex TaxID=187734 RepID=A0A177DHK5_ALTAL|nr:hypothetical protein CC77DRAFT_1062894 [Alternaria alternata]XP_051587165.1 uncharacterized protein J4E82_006877 [Alternaria postmessia]RYN25008.1 hypothetical protein AA0115_g7735 [Alternaria tenuissima]KAH6864506.1 hypothetical protein B0T12DRAFT_390871 [Alternaria alternata]KAI5374462.1 hypothetical protein J4E82_006877 [Alternaria postmessia]OAG18976.1 hypothetical protein CC77DRAFT_1062894 [Alternaria alternata]OWY46665.1 hypothetical protein AALT_g2648 [Alternaria alternata]
MSPHSTQDPCIPYGRGGAGNMRRRSSIAAAWSTILSHPSPTDSNKLNLVSSPEEHYAASKSEPRRRRHSSSTSEEGSEGSMRMKSSVDEGARRRRSSVWSGRSRASTAGESGSRWRRLLQFRRAGGRIENEAKNEDVE